MKESEGRWRRILLSRRGRFCLLGMNQRLPLALEFVITFHFLKMYHQEYTQTQYLVVVGLETCTHKSTVILTAVYTLTQDSANELWPIASLWWTTLYLSHFYWLSRCKGCQEQTTTVQGYQVRMNTNCFILWQEILQRVLTPAYQAPPAPHVWFAKDKTKIIYTHYSYRRHGVWSGL
jgi:hypothetical protein